VLVILQPHVGSLAAHFVLQYDGDLMIAMSNAENALSA
jgi:hypothetical protein